MTTRPTTSASATAAPPPRPSAARTGPAAGWPLAGRTKPGLLAVGLAALLLVPAPARTPLAALLLVAGGLPHGASDHLVAGPVWRARFGRAGAPAFLVAYLLLAGTVFSVWRAVPTAALLGFLALSAWHFSEEDARGRSRWERVARGLMPVGLPALLHPAALVELLEPMVGGSSPDARLVGGVMAAAGVSALVALAGWWRAERRLPGEAWAAALALIACPPLLGFALFFALGHSRRAAGRRRAGLGLDRRGYALAVAPTVLGGAAVLAVAAWWLPGAGPAGWLVIGLAALTVPHMLLVPEGVGSPLPTPRSG